MPNKSLSNYVPKDKKIPKIRTQGKIIFSLTYFFYSSFLGKSPRFLVARETAGEGKLFPLDPLHLLFELLHDLAVLFSTSGNAT